MTKKRLAIITTHPIQYNAPWYQLLTERGIIDIKVFYTWSQSEKGSKYDPGFKKDIEWDIPLLTGYDYEFVENTSAAPGTRNYGGIKNPSLLEKIKGYSPDAIMVTGWNFDSHLKCLRYFHKKIPVFFRGDSTLLDEGSGIKVLVRRMILSTVFRYVDKALYVGLQNREYFIKHGLKENELSFAPHAIDNHRFASNESSLQLAADMRIRLGIEASSLVFLFAGKLESKKDPALLAAAFREMDDEGIQLVFVGNGELEEQLKSENAGIKNIHFMDFQNQRVMPAVYQLADVFVLPSKGPGETWGLAINEAMASGKPVLVSNKCGGAGDLVENAVNGYVFRSGNKAELRELLELYVGKKQELAAMGAASLEKIRAFSFNEIARVIEKLVTEIK